MPAINLDYSQFNDEKREFSVLPDGNYNVKVLGSCFEPYLSGNGVALAFRLQVQDGPHKGRILFHKPAYEHTSDKWKAKGHKDIRDLHRACGFETLDDTDHLNEKLLQVSVGIEEGRGSYKSRNIIKRAWKYGAPLDVKKKVKPLEKKQPDYDYEDDDVPF